MKQYQVVIPVYKQMLIDVPDHISEEDIDGYIQKEVLGTDLDREDDHHIDYDNMTIDFMDDVEDDEE